MCGVVLNFDGISMSWNDLLLDIISIITTQSYMETVLDVTKWSDECHFVPPKY